MKKETRADSVGGLFLVGFLMIGIALGIFYGSAAVGTLLGLGAGFISFGLAKLLLKN